MNSYEHIFSFHVPFPPMSVNDIYKGSIRKKYRTYANKTVQELIDYWRKDVPALIKERMKEHGIKKQEEGVFKVEIEIAPKFNNRKYDLDNYLKLPLDALVGTIIKDDLFINEINARRGLIGSGTKLALYKITNGESYYLKQ